MIAVYLMNGNCIYLRNCDYDDFISMTRRMRCWWRRSITWRRMWFRKRDIFTFELIDPPKDTQTI